MLAPPIPNPTTGTAQISFSLADPAARVQLALYDAGGRMVRQLLNGPLSAGDHTRVWDGRLDGRSMAAPGIYFLRLDAQELGAATTKVILVH